MYRLACYALSTLLLSLAIAFADIPTATRVALLLVWYANMNITSKAFVAWLDERSAK